MFFITVPFNIIQYNKLLFISINFRTFSDIPRIFFSPLLILRSITKGSPQSLTVFTRSDMVARLGVWGLLKKMGLRTNCSSKDLRLSQKDHVSSFPRGRIINLSTQRLPCNEVDRTTKRAVRWYPQTNRSQVRNSGPVATHPTNVVPQRLWIFNSRARPGSGDGSVSTGNSEAN